MERDKTTLKKHEGWLADRQAILEEARAASAAQRAFESSAVFPRVPPLS
jgi:hypothetical protein